MILCEYFMFLFLFCYVGVILQIKWYAHYEKLVFTCDLKILNYFFNYWYIYLQMTVSAHEPWVAAGDGRSVARGDDAFGATVLPAAH